MKGNRTLRRELIIQNIIMTNNKNTKHKANKNNKQRNSDKTRAPYNHQHIIRIITNKTLLIKQFKQRITRNIIRTTHIQLTAIRHIIRNKTRNARTIRRITRQIIIKRRNEGNARRTNNNKTTH